MSYRAQLTDRRFGAAKFSGYGFRINRSASERIIFNPTFANTSASNNPEMLLKVAFVLHTLNVRQNIVHIGGSGSFGAGYTIGLTTANRLRIGNASDTYYYALLPDILTTGVLYEVSVLIPRLAASLQTPNWQAYLNATYYSPVSSGITTGGSGTFVGAWASTTEFAIGCQVTSSSNNGTGPGNGRTNFADCTVYEMLLLYQTQQPNGAQYITRDHLEKFHNRGYGSDARFFPRYLDNTSVTAHLTFHPSNVSGTNQLTRLRTFNSQATVEGVTGLPSSKFPNQRIGNLIIP